jgi:hypothetical protein
MPTIERDGSTLILGVPQHIGDRHGHEHDPEDDAQGDAVPDADPRRVGGDTRGERVDR